MSIDIETETLFPLTEFNKHWPGKPVQRGAITRYVLQGIHVPGVEGRVKLDSIMIGFMRYSSDEAVRRFIEAQNKRNTSVPGVSKTQRKRQSAAAGRQLQEMLAR